jgi:hypothetical protein
MAAPAKHETFARLQSRITSAAAELKKLEKSPEQALEMLRLLLAAAEGDRSITAQQIWAGWSPIQFWAAYQLACLCAWSSAPEQGGAQNVTLISIHALDYADAHERYERLKLS